VKDYFAGKSRHRQASERVPNKKVVIDERRREPQIKKLTSTGVGMTSRIQKLTSTSIDVNFGIENLSPTTSVINLKTKSSENQTD